MKRFAVAAAVLIGMGFPVLAQHGGVHGGFGGHVSAPVGGGVGRSGPIGGGGMSRGGPSGGGAPRFAGGPRNTVAPQAPPRSAPGMSYANMRARQMPGLRRDVSRPAYPTSGSSHYGQNGHDGHDGHDHGGHDHYRHAYVSVYSYGYPYGYGFVPWVAPWGGWIGSGYSDDNGYYDDSAINSGYQDAGYYSQPVQDQWPEPRPAYQPQTVESLSPQTEPSPAATLIFKDGRAPEQIHNYLLSRTTVFVMDKPQREIPVAQLDVAATEKVNRGYGVDFHLPAVAK